MEDAKVGTNPPRVDSDTHPQLSLISDVCANEIVGLIGKKEGGTRLTNVATHLHDF